jgi:hypothetical protein
MTSDMHNSAFYVLCNESTGSTTRHEEFGAALRAVDCLVNDGDEWTISEVDPLRLELALCDRRRAPLAVRVADGCGPGLHRTAAGWVSALATVSPRIHWGPMTLQRQRVMGDDAGVQSFHRDSAGLRRGGD